MAIEKAKLDEKATDEIIPLEEYDLDGFREILIASKNLLLKRYDVDKEDVDHLDPFS